MNIELKSLIAGLIGAILVFSFGDRLFSSRNKKKLLKIKYELGAVQEYSEPKNIPERLLTESAGMIRLRMQAMDCKSTYSINRDNTTGVPFISMIVDNVSDTALVRDMVRNNGSLQIWETYSPLEVPAIFSAFENTQEQLYPPASTTYFGDVLEIDSSVVGNILRSPMVIQSLPADAKYCFGPNSYASKKPGAARLFSLYMLRTRGRAERAQIENADIADAKAVFEPDGRPVVLFQFTAAGSRTWEDMTGRNIKKALAIVVNNQVISAPVVDGKITGGKATISGYFTVKECQALAALLKDKPLPVSVTILSEQNLGEQTASSLTKWLFVCLAFAISYGATWFVFKTLKAT